MVSCVVPSYENLHLLSRCLISILTQEGVDLEVIVSDDSRSSAIADLVAFLQPRFPALRYTAGARSGNPVDNWNMGLDAARGRYVVVVHHDEFFLHAGVLAQAVSMLETERYDVAIGRVAVIGPSRHGWIPRPLLRATPLWMMFVVNTIGPTACVIYRRSMSMRFDPKLIQLVDVEFYNRLLRAAERVRFSAVLSIGSLVHSERISARIDPYRLQLSEGIAISRDDSLDLSPLARQILRLALRVHALFRGVS